MRRCLYLFIGLLVPFLSSGNDRLTDLFNKGNGYYDKAQYKEALAAYQQVLNGGYLSAALYFNMGNASYKDGDIPSALLYLEKAHKLSPGDDDINFNIRYVNSKTTDKIDEIPEFFLARWWRSFLLSLPANMFAVFSVVLILLASGLFSGYLFSNSVSLKKTSFFSSLAMFVVGIFFIILAAAQTGYFSGHQQAIVFNGAVDVKNAPNAKLGTLFIIHEGALVNVLDRSNGWLKIRLANGSEGWIMPNAIKEI